MIHDLLQPYFSQDEFAALYRYWKNADNSRFNRCQPVNETNVRLIEKNLHESLCKAIDKQQNIT